MRYNVTEYYLATGMEGIPYEKDYGDFEADSKEDAMYQACKTIPGFDQKKWDSLPDSLKYFAMTAHKL